MKPSVEAKFYESYRIGYKRGYLKGTEDALRIFKDLQQLYDFTIEDKEFYLALKDLEEEANLQLE
jgi:hypothetical protein